MTEQREGPLSYQNWKAQQEEKPSQRIFEFPCYTNAHIIGEIRSSLGPYQILNSLSLGSARPSLILRIQSYKEFEKPNMDQSHVQFYHGGEEVDEIVALVSLCLGIQLKAGVANRIFEGDQDPIGNPIGSTPSPDPNPLDVRAKSSIPILKNVLGNHELSEATIIATLIDLNVENIIALIRAARMYQDAVWIAENGPELSWLLLTSAIETVANRWYIKGKNEEDKIQAMRDSHHKLESVLRKYCQSSTEALISEVAEVLFPKSLARRKFVGFIIEFLPPPPAIRPAPFARISWEPEDMTKILTMVYNYRSRALHDGIPFPGPMCIPPMIAGDTGELAEKPHGLATSMRGSVWLKEDLPLHLNTFEYIVRNAILNWWKSLVEE